MIAGYASSLQYLAFSIRLELFLQMTQKHVSIDI